MKCGGGELYFFKYLSRTAVVELLSHRKPACTKSFIVHFSLVIQFVEDMDCSYQSIQVVSLTELHKTKIFAKYMFGSNETVCHSGPGWVMNGLRSVGDPVH